MAVKLGNILLSRMEGGTDTHTAMAVERARSIVDELTHAGADPSNLDMFNVAIVDRLDGLAVFRDLAPRVPQRGIYETSGGHHFASALCGYGGTGPHGSAEILELFGFGDRKELLAQINHGDDRARFYFCKGADVLWLPRR